MGDGQHEERKQRIAGKDSAASERERFGINVCAHVNAHVFYRNKGFQGAEVIVILKDELGFSVATEGFRSSLNQYKVVMCINY